MALMKTQCAVLPTKVKGGAAGSKCRALTGNALNPPIEYKTSIGTRITRGITKPRDEVGTAVPTVPYFASSSISLHDYQIISETLYGQYDMTADYSQIAPFTSPPITPTGWTNQSTCDSIHLGFSGVYYNSWPSYTGDSSGAPVWAAYNLGAGQPLSFNMAIGPNVGQPQLSQSSYTDGWWYAFGFDPSSGNLLISNVHVAVTNPCDYSGDFSTVVSDTLGQTWNWNLGRFDLGYSQAPSSYTGNGVGLGSYTASNYTGAMGKTTQSVATTNSISNDYFGCRNGWNAITGKITAWRGIAKNTQARPMPYFIGRCRQGQLLGGGFGGYDASAVSSGSYTYQIIELIDSGMIPSGSVISYNATAPDINFPFPTTTGFPRVDLGNNILTTDFYFAIIGAGMPTIGTFTSSVH